MSTAEPPIEKPSRKKPGPVSRYENEDAAYEAKRRQAAARSAMLSMVGRDIGPPPDVPADLVQLVEDCRFNLKLFCESFFAETFSLAWSDEHLETITDLERAALEGLKQTIAHARGSGKTALFLACVVWCLVYGHRSFILLVSATDDDAGALLQSIKTSFETNRLLGQCFRLCVIRFERWQETQPKRMVNTSLARGHASSGPLPRFTCLGSLAQLRQARSFGRLVSGRAFVVCSASFRMVVRLDRTCA